MIFDKIPEPKSDLKMFGIEMLQSRSTVSQDRLFSLDADLVEAALPGI